MEKNPLPSSFLNSLPTHIGAESKGLLSALNEKSPVSIRFNPFKNHEDFEASRPIPWTKSGYYLSERPAFYADPYFHSGAYYVQEASSMIVEFILQQLELDEKDLMALDLCAAPGGKSTILSSFLENRGILISNEIVWKRNLILQENIERWGQANAIITHNGSKEFSFLHEIFDFALVDAPCSGEGMFRKDPAVIKEWSEENVRSCCERQSVILKDISRSIKTGGYLIYSTCTYNRDENENQIDDFLENNPFECIEIPGIEKFGIVESRGEQSVFYRLFPHKLEGEGLSICLLRKTGSNSNSKFRRKPQFNQNLKELSAESVKVFINPESHLKFLQRDREIFAINALDITSLLKWIPNLKVIRYGTPIGEMNRGELIPSHALALSIHLNEGIPKIDLDNSQALRVLQRDSSTLRRPETEEKWVRLSFEKNTIAFAKVLPNRVNIHLPKTFRIRKNIDSFL